MTKDRRRGSGRAAGRALRTPTRHSRGLLVLLVGPEARGKDVLIAAARRRFAHDPHVAFPLRAITRPSGAMDQHVSLSHSAFRDIEAAGGFLASWQAAGQSYALPASVHEQLDAGHTIVVAAAPEAVGLLHAAWDRVHVIELLAGPDPFRPRSARGSCSGGSHAGGLADAPAALRPLHRRIHHQGDLAFAVRRFLDALDAVLVAEAGGRGPARRSGEEAGPIGRSAGALRVSKTMAASRPA